MPSVITDVQPRRFRSGDSVTITGSGFSPVFGQNKVHVELGAAAFITFESDTSIIFEVPAGIPTNQIVGVIASRLDTQEASQPFNAWSLATTAQARDFEQIMPGQAPGPREAAHLDVDVPDVGQAIDYERLAAHSLRIANEILKQTGDIFTSDGSLPVRLPIGGGGMELHTRTAEVLDLHWGPSSRWLALRWGLSHDQAIADRDLVANGDPGTPTGSLAIEHGTAFDGTLTRIGVLVHNIDPGDNMDRVRILVNAVEVHNSGTGLGLGTGQNYTATLSIAVQQGDQIRIQVRALGTNANVGLTAGVRFQEVLNVAQADTLGVTDTVAVVKTGNQAASSQDVSAVSDLVTAGLS